MSDAKKSVIALAAAAVAVFVIFEAVMSMRTPQQKFIDECTVRHTIPACYMEWERRHEKDPYPSDTLK